jgi:hypothetical protein
MSVGDECTALCERTDYEISNMDEIRALPTFSFLRRHFG